MTDLCPLACTVPADCPHPGPGQCPHRGADPVHVDGQITLDDVEAPHDQT